MTAALSVVTRYFPLDCDHDISAEVWQLSMDGLTNWVTATHGSPPSAGLQAIATALQPTPSGFTRYWVSAPTGPGSQLPLNVGLNHVHGKIADSPNTPYFVWRVLLGPE